jgi:release factor glutamine methyltransferase
MNFCVGQALAEAARSIARSDARLLLQQVLGVGHAQLAAHPDRMLCGEQRTQFERLVKRRMAGEPVAYVIGEREFYGLPFKVTRAVLIPRPETELLVDLALERIAPGGAARILDLGTGSGAVAIAIARNRPAAEVWAVDSSAAALEVARCNARRLLRAAQPWPAGTKHQAQFPPQVRLVLSDWFGALGAGKYELIVANPPYVAAGDPHLDEGDLRFEPRNALEGGPDGLAAIRTLTAQAPSHLARGGWLMFEHGYDQGAKCEALMAESGFTGVACYRDLAGIPRVTVGRAE